MACFSFPSRPCFGGAAPLGGTIFRIIGTDKVTNRLVDVAIADNDTEKRMILREERKNYYDLRAIPLRMSYQAFYAAEVGA
ncbi:MAG: hypothetical protein M1377_01335 [Deltaproteobacteria bacterium]|nr:hypothetical protein [Deltaproteobacteria bacterium]